MSAGDLDIPVHDFSSPGPPTGRSVYLQGQLHANESAAMLVLHDLVRRLREEPPANRVRVVPNANPVGWERYLSSGQGRWSANGTNWNRMFADPLRQSGSIDDVLASRLWQLSQAFDVVIDVHTPDFGWPHLYASSADHRLATMDDIPHVLYGAPTVGPFDESHLRCPEDRAAPAWASVTLEIPSHEIPTPELVRHWSERLSWEIGAQARSTERTGEPEWAGSMVDLVSHTSGAVVLRCEPGKAVAAGEPILTIRGRRGEEETITAPSACLPVCFRRQTVVQAGYWACRVISLT